MNWDDIPHVRRLHIITSKCRCRFLHADPDHRQSKPGDTEIWRRRELHQSSVFKDLIQYGRFPRAKYWIGSHAASHSTEIVRNKGSSQQGLHPRRTPDTATPASPVICWSLSTARLSHALTEGPTRCLPVSSDGALGALHTYHVSSNALSKVDEHSLIIIVDLHKEFLAFLCST